MRKINVDYRGLADDRRGWLQHQVYCETLDTPAGVIVDEASAVNFASIARTLTSQLVRQKGADMRTPISARSRKQPMLILNGIRLAAYDGTLAGFYPGGFKWPAKTGWGAEIFNFKQYRGRCYGHAETLGQSIHIEKLGAHPRDKHVNGILVVWTAPSPEGGRTVVGWYSNATVYRDRRKPRGGLAAARTYDNTVCTYIVEAAERDCHLVHPEEARVLTIPKRKRGQRHIPGMSSIYYPALHGRVGARIEDRIRRYIRTGQIPPLREAKNSTPGKGNRAAGRVQVDPERRKGIEDAAVKFVRNHFENKLKYKVEDRQQDYCGYDLRATRGDEILCIEVKGRSGKDITADFTINEYETIKKFQSGQFGDGSYRICIVTDALNDANSREMHHFWYLPRQGKRGTGEWRKVNGAAALQLRPLEAARATARRSP